MRERELEEEPQRDTDLDTQTSNNVENYLDPDSKKKKSAPKKLLHLWENLVDIININQLLLTVSMIKVLCLFFKSSYLVEIFRCIHKMIEVSEICFQLQGQQEEWGEL